MDTQSKSGNLPPLPTPDRIMWQYGKQINHYTEEQMRAYAQSALDALLDEADAEIQKMISAGLGQKKG